VQHYHTSCSNIKVATSVAAALTVLFNAADDEKYDESIAATDSIDLGIIIIIIVIVSFFVFLLCILTY